MFSHPLPFDPTYGYDLTRLLQVPAPPGPADFADFWQRTYRETMAVPPDVSAREVSPGEPRVRVFEVEYSGLGGFRVGAWVTLPRDGPVTRGFVIGHGYGGRAAPDPTPPLPAAAAIFPCARGFNRSARPDLPDNAARHVIHGLEHRDIYLHRFCVADLWSAASALQQFVNQRGLTIGPRIDYIGVSFGGGIGAMALPWDPRFRRAYLEVPSFGNHPLRVTLPCTGSGEAVRVYHAHRPQVLDVLAYFDSATAARRLRIPVFFCNALFDPAVPPPGQFAVHNACLAPKELFIRQAGHFDHPGVAEEDRQLSPRRAAWFATGE